MSLEDPLTYKRGPYPNSNLPSSSRSLQANERKRACLYAIQEDRCGYAWAQRQDLNRHERKRAKKACQRCRLSPSTPATTTT